MIRTHTARLMVTACLSLFALAATADPTELRAIARDYYVWQAEAYPVNASSNGEHRYDSRLTDFDMAAILGRRRHVSELLARVRAIHDTGWGKDDLVDRLLFQTQLAAADFFGRERNPEASDPQLYVNECSNAIFSLLQKEYAPTRTRALAARERLKQMPALLITARSNLTQPVKLYAALVIEAALATTPLTL